MRIFLHYLYSEFAKSSLHATPTYRRGFRYTLEWFYVKNRVCAVRIFLIVTSSSMCGVVSNVFREYKIGLDEWKRQKTMQKICGADETLHVEESYPNFWKDEVAFYSDRVFFVYKHSPLNSANAPKARDWRKKCEGLLMTGRGSKELAGGNRLHLPFLPLLIVKVWFSKFHTRKWEVVSLKNSSARILAFVFQSVNLKRTVDVFFAWTTTPHKQVKLHDMQCKILKPSFTKFQPRHVPDRLQSNRKHFPLGAEKSWAWSNSKRVYLLKLSSSFPRDFWDHLTAFQLT